MAIIDRIKYDGPVNGSSWLAHKYQSDQFVLGSQLIVNQSQEALFLRGGEALDLFGPGTHTLKTGNLPLLNKLVNLPFGGKTPFSAEVYYINKTSRLDMNWGTLNPIPFEDPKYGLLLSIRSHGQYGVTINDTRLFISHIVGAIPNGATCDYYIVSRYFNGLINSKIKDITAKFMIRKKISFLEITAYLDELSLEYKNAINDEFNRFGIEIMNFYVSSITPPKEEYAKLRELKEEIALGKDFYSERRSFDVLDKLAGNSAAGGMATAGLGLGMGVGAAASVRDAFAGIANQIKTDVPSQNSDNDQVCSKCQAKVQKGSKFCGECGTKILTQIKCTSCGTASESNMKFCVECGKPLIPVKCSDCGTEIKSGMKFCGNCGKKVGV